MKPISCTIIPRPTDFSRIMHWYSSIPEIVWSMGSFLNPFIESTWTSRVAHAKTIEWIGLRNLTDVTSHYEHAEDAYGITHIMSCFQCRVEKRSAFHHFAKSIPIPMKCRITLPLIQPTYPSYGLTPLVLVNKWIYPHQILTNLNLFLCSMSENWQNSEHERKSWIEAIM